MRLNPIDDNARLTTEQKAAIKKVREAEEEYFKVVTDVTNNLITNARWASIGKTHMQQATMAYRRAISKPNEL